MARVTPVIWTRVDTALGAWFAASSERGLCLVAFDVSYGRAALERWIARWEPGAEAVAEGARMAPVARALGEYAGGRRRDFDLELDLRGSEFELSVYRALVAIPFGATRTYGELARELGDARLARAVGGACGRNPVPIVVPCHRVLASHGLGGFSAGLDCKRSLLRLEGHAAQARLF